MQQIGVHRERRFAALVLRDRNLVGLGEFEELRAAGQIPFPPRRDHLDVGLQCIIGELEAHLVVAFARCAMGHRIGPGLLGDFDLLLGDQRPRDGGAQQIDAFIKRIGAEHRKHIVADEFLPQILDENVLRLDAEELGLLRAGSSSSPCPRSAVKVTTSAP